MDASLRFYTSGTVISGFDEDGLMQQHVTAPLHAVTNPEEKRRIIGDTFIKIANEAMLDLDLQADKVFLAQGKLLIILGSFKFSFFFQGHSVLT